MSNTTSPSAPAHALRAFNRFYTRRIGVLGDGGPATGTATYTTTNTTAPCSKAGAGSDARFSLTEARVLWELAHRPGLTAAVLVAELGLNAGYMSRLLARLQQRGLLRTQRGAVDARQKPLVLTTAGRRSFAVLDRRAQEKALALLDPLSTPQQQELLYATQRIQQLLMPAQARGGQASELCALRPGDLGWVVARHGALYAAEYHWDQRFEALVARIAADYVDQLDPARENAWIAQVNGHAMGCVFLVQARHQRTGKPLPGVAQLRLLLVEPAARGQGVGKRLVQQCHHFAAQAGYRRVRLWTNSVLLAARGIYVAAGYRLLRSAPHHSFGHALVGEVWEKVLTAQDGV